MTSRFTTTAKSGCSTPSSRTNNIANAKSIEAFRKQMQLQQTKAPTAVAPVSPAPPTPSSHHYRKESTNFTQSLVVGNRS